MSQEAVNNNGNDNKSSSNPKDNHKRQQELRKKSIARNKIVKGRKPINWKLVMIIGIFAFYMIAEFFTAYKDAKPSVGTITYDKLFDELEADNVEMIYITKSDDIASVEMKDGTTYDMVNPQSDTFIEDLMKAGAQISYRKQSMVDVLASMMIIVPMAVLMAFFTFYIARTTAGANTRQFTLLKNKMNMTTFDDVRGISETRKEVQFIVENMRNWKQLAKLGARPVKGVLFYGPPGTGKTLLAKAIAHEAGVAFVSASGSDFNEVFVGTGARRIRDLWDLAASNAPCILFIDEIDCIGKRRGRWENSENTQTINALLQRMDGLNSMAGVLVIGATNNKEALDDALLRSGRFDREFYIGPPKTKADREDVVELYLENKKLDEGVTLENASKLLVGLTAADIDEALSEAVYISLIDGRHGVLKLSDIDEAAMKLHMSGVEKEHSSDRDVEISAVHEAGHTIMSLLCGLKVLKVSVVAYSSGAGGVTMEDTDDTGDQQLKLRSEFTNKLKVLLAGKCAEDIIYGEHTQGCQNDLDVATKLCYQMITSFGMDEKGESPLVNEATLVELGVLRSTRDNTISEMNRMLSSMDKEATEELSKTENLTRIRKLSQKLIKDKTVVSPTLEWVDSLELREEHTEPDETTEETEETEDSTIEYNK